MTPGTFFAYFTISYCNGKVVSEWTHSLQPTEILAYTSAAANWLMVVAHASGAAIFFWRRAVQGNVPLANLHYHWESSTGAMGALKALIRWRAVCVSVGTFNPLLWVLPLSLVDKMDDNLVTILVAVTSLLRGPMMQRALSVRTVQPGPSGTRELGVLPTTQVWDLEPLDDYDWKHPFWDVIREYRAKTPIRIPGAESCNNCAVAVEVSANHTRNGLLRDCINPLADLNLPLNSFWASITPNQLRTRFRLIFPSVV